MTIDIEVAGNLGDCDFHSVHVFIHFYLTTEARGFCDARGIVKAIFLLFCCFWNDIVMFLVENYMARSTGQTAFTGTF